MIKNTVAILARTALICAPLLLAGCDMELLAPKGDIGQQEKTLILVALGLMSLVVIPVIVLSLVFAWKYRASNTAAEYDPEWSHSTLIEVVVWGVPAVIIAILAVITWRTSHSLDPYRPLQAEKPAIRIEAVALDWKWLFIYPDYGIATVNELAFPTDAPLNFRITSDTVMNGLFIPQLGSQIYAMANMETKLHLIAREEGVFDGFSANYSGGGFSGMRFKAIATSDQGFAEWVAKAQSTELALNAETYGELAVPSEHVEVQYYALAEPKLFNSVLFRHLNGEAHDSHVADAELDLPMCRNPTDPADTLFVSVVTE